MFVVTKRLASRAALTPRTSPLLPMIATRFVGEPTGLQKGASSQNNLHRHDTLGLVAGVGQTVVDSYASWGFVVNGVALHSAVLLLPNASFIFEPESLAEVTPASLSILQLLENPARMLVIGCGRRSQRVPSEVRAWSAKHGIAIEALSTQHAASTFNFMVAEDRPVAAIMFPNGAA